MRIQRVSLAPVKTGQKEPSVLQEEVTIHLLKQAQGTGEKTRASYTRHLLTFERLQLHSEKCRVFREEVQ